MLWDFQELYLLFLCLSDEGIFNVISSAAAEWHRNDLAGVGGAGGGDRRHSLCRSQRGCASRTVSEMQQIHHRGGGTPLSRHFPQARQVYVILSVRT